MTTAKASCILLLHMWRGDTNLSWLLRWRLFVQEYVDKTGSRDKLRVR